MTTEEIVATIKEKYQIDFVADYKQLQNIIFVATIIPITLSIRSQIVSIPIPSFFMFLRIQERGSR